jgi:hypothetical protein
MTREEPEPIDLEKTLRMMDVADEMRRRRQRVEEHLEASDREKIRQHLLEQYRAMGHEANPSLLDEAIDTVLSQQQRFRRPEPGVGLRLAELYVRRGELVRKVGVPLVALFVLALAAGAAIRGVHLVRSGREAHQVEQIEQLTGRADVLLQAIRDFAQDPEAVSQAEALFGEVRRGRAGGVQDLSDLYERLNQEYTMVITSGRERDRVRHYLIVQAIGPNRRPLSVKIRNEETGGIEEVTEWGERVEKEIYDRVARDYEDNNVVDDNLFGRKRRGFLEPERRYPLLGQITRW